MDKNQNSSVLMALDTLWGNNQICQAFSVILHLTSSFLQAASDRLLVSPNRLRSSSLGPEDRRVQTSEHHAPNLYTLIDFTETLNK